MSESGNIITLNSHVTVPVLGSMSEFSVTSLSSVAITDYVPYPIDLSIMSSSKAWCKTTLILDLTPPLQRTPPDAYQILLHKPKSIKLPPFTLSTRCSDLNPNVQFLYYNATLTNGEPLPGFLAIDSISPTIHLVDSTG